MKQDVSLPVMLLLLGLISAVLGGVSFYYNYRVYRLELLHAEPLELACYYLLLSVYLSLFWLFPIGCLLLGWRRRRVSDGYRKSSG